MMAANKVDMVVDHLIEWLGTHGFKGYDPYDALSSPLGAFIDSLNPFLGRVFIHLLKNAPFNPRPILGIDKDLDAKALGLLAVGHLSIGRMKEDRDLISRGMSCIDLLEEIATPGYAGKCWGHPFPYRSSRLYLEANEPSVVSTVYAGQAFLEAYDQDRDTRHLDVAESAGTFIRDELTRIGYPRGFVISYIPKAALAIHNASLLAASFLSRLDYLRGIDENASLIEGATFGTLDDQNDDGSWFYDAPASGEERPKLIDNFHTGFVLESLLDIYSHTSPKHLLDPIKRGIEYYQSMFETDGKPKHTLDRPDPVDLRDCAQAMIVFSKAHRILGGTSQYLANTEKVFGWTATHMRNSDGSFRFLSWKRYRPRTRFTRFQGWILWGLANMLQNMHSEARRKDADG